MTEPRLSVVVASVNGFPYLGDCLDALTNTASWAEIIVADSTDEATRARVRESWPAARLLSFDTPTTIPELRAAGIAAATAPHIALIEDHCVVRPGWAELIVRQHDEGHAVVGGPIHNAVDDRVRDWAAFFCEYSAYLEPGPSGPAPGLPGMNVSYDRTAIAAIADLLADGRWETWLHARLLERGFELWADPALVIDHAKDFDLREFLSQRYHYSRSYAGMRNPDLGWKRALYVLASPLLPPLLYARIAGNVLHAGGRALTLVAATPLVFLYLAVWTYGEAVGYTFGGGHSLLEVR